MLSEACAWLGGGSVLQWLWSIDHTLVKVFLYRHDLCISTKTAYNSLVSSVKCSLHGQLIVMLLKPPQMLLGPRISMLNLDTVTVMNGFLYHYQLKGIDSQDLR